ncbi:MAG: glycosyltransferase [Kiritimatiellae bacterium]|nr:glycosyltransferase [Kiritimatiellia bacterium]
MRTGKLLSIVVPAYNMSDYLPKCLGSIIVDDKGLLQKLEVIVVNDGSKDRTSEIAHDFEAKYPDVFRVIDKDNGNYGSCINAALPIVSGAFVKILDADDSFDTAAFAKMLQRLDESERSAEQVDLLLTDFVEVDENGSEKLLRSMQLQDGVLLAVDTIDRMPLLYMHSIAYRTENLRRLKYRQTEGVSYTDNEWTYYPMKLVRRIRYERLPVYRYLVGRAGQTMSQGVLRRSAWMVALIARRMTENFATMILDVPIVISKYLEDFVVMMNVKVYNLAILNVHNKEGDSALKEFDEVLVSKAGAIHEKVMARLVSRRIGFYYGRYWRAHKSSNTIRLCAFRGYIRMVGWMRRKLHD